MSHSTCVLSVAKSPQDYQVFRISPHDTNRLAIIFDPTTADISVTVCVEIFDVGGSTPVNRHTWAAELFYVLKGEGIAECDGRVIPIQAGDSLLVPPTGIHKICNTGTTRLYVLSIMVPNENFAEQIRRGLPSELDEEDWQVLSHTQERSRG